MSELIAAVGRAAPWLAAIATAVCALELLVVRRQIAHVFALRGMTALLALQLASALAMPLPAPLAAVPAWIAAATTLAIAVRFRGAYNGGSDAMLVIVLVAHAVTRTVPGTSLAAAVQLYAAVQLTLSYFIAGIAKLGDPAWRTGRALPVLVELPHYRVPAWARSALRSRLGVVAAYAMVVVECAFPLVWIDAHVGVALLLAGAVFHVTNAIVFGLNRFLWIWLAAYPFLLARYA